MTQIEEEILDVFFDLLDANDGFPDPDDLERLMKLTPESKREFMRRMDARVGVGQTAS